MKTRSLGRTSAAAAGCPASASGWVRPGWFGLWLLVSVCAPARAELSAPDNVIYGLIVLDGQPVTAEASHVMVEARRSSGMPVARYRMGQQVDAGHFYVLSLPMEEASPLRDPNAILVNETILLAVVSQGVDRAVQNLAVTERGQVIRIDLGTGSTNGLSGFEAWASSHGLPTDAQNLDVDGDGVSNWAEFTAGTHPKDPASRFILRIGSIGGTPQVSFDALRAEGPGYEQRTRRYALQRLAGASGGVWQSVPGYEAIPGANQQVTYLPSSGATAECYRGLVWLESEGTAADDFRLAMMNQGGLTTVSFTALGRDALGRDRYYTLESTTNVAGPWLALPGYTNILGAGQTVSHEILNPVPDRSFFRARFEARAP